MGGIGPTRSSPAANPGETAHVLRMFGLKLALFVTVWGALFFKGEWTRYGYWIAAWYAVLSFGLLFPLLLRPVRRAVIPVGAWIGRALAYTALAVIYFGVIAPLGIFARVIGKKFLTKGKDPEAATYWIARESAPLDPGAWERQY